MKLTIFNGSPKLGKGNTEVLLDRFIEGFTFQNGNQIEIYQLNKLDSMEDAVRIFDAAEVVLLAFPLYCYAMPGGVKLFIEALEPLCGRCSHKKLGFLVQYGFHEAIHARPLEKYNIELAKILGCDYLGTIIKGGCDGLASGKGLFNKSILQGIYKIGLAFGKAGRLDLNELAIYSAPEFEKKHNVWLMKLILKLINKVYWSPMLKKNGVTLAESFARPYEVKTNYTAN